MPHTESILSRADVAEALGVHPTTISKWAHAGHFKTCVWTPNRRFLGMQRADLDAWIKAQTAQSSPADSQ